MPGGDLKITEKMTDHIFMGKKCYAIDCVNTHSHPHVQIQILTVL